MQGHIRKRGKRSWAIVIEAGVDAQGKRKQRWQSVKGTKKEAEVKLTELLSQRNKGIYIEPSKLLLKEYLDKWLTDYAKPTTSPKTYERYSQIISRVCEDIGQLKLTQIKPLHIQGHYTKCISEKGRKDGKGGLSSQTVLHHHRVLKEAFRQALKWQLLVYNPLEAVEPPRPIKREMQVIDETQIGFLLKSLKGHKIYYPVLLTIFTGLRRGELLALRWKDLDLQKGQMVIQQSLIQTKHGVFFKSPKTHRSRRKIALSTLTVEHLKQHRATQAEQKLKLGTAYENNDLVFALDNGQVWSPNGFTSTYVHTLRQKKIPHINFHGLRHSHATMLLKQSTHPKIVSERLGHSTIATTLDIYSHVLPGMQEGAAQKIDELLNLSF